MFVYGNMCVGDYELNLQFSIVTAELEQAVHECHGTVNDYETHLIQPLARSGSFLR